MNVRAAIISVMLLVATHYTAYWYGSKKPAEIVERETVKYNVVTQIKEVTRPDGTKETTTTITDKTKETAAKSVPVFAPEKQWVVGAYYRLNNPTYALSVSRRLVGPFSASAFGDLTGNLYLGLTVEF